MIYILDDSYGSTKLGCDTSFIKNYTDIILYGKEEAQKDIISSLLDKLTKDDCLCMHKSLIVRDVESNENFKFTIESTVKQKGIKFITFSRGVNSNFEAKTIDKIQFYNNLKFFADSSTQGNYEFKALYYGENYKMMHRMDLANKIITLVYTSKDFWDLDCNEDFVSWIEELGGKDASNEINSWKGKTRENIRKIINEMIPL